MHGHKHTETSTNCDQHGEPRDRLTDPTHNEHGRCQKLERRAEWVDVDVGRRKGRGGGGGMRGAPFIHSLVVLRMLPGIETMFLAALQMEHAKPLGVIITHG